MERPSKRLFRCAIYTRKSTDHNLDLEFNSLDAQREACEAYIKSQAHEGWRLIPARYDDGAFSGASMYRPALQQLLADLQAGKVDIVVVYKVDRLTRSLADFAKLVELFDRHSVSFVSVTQSFNTTSSMGRLTLNVLLSFAQFEREVIGERVRDKIAASKKKGIWVGGPIPLGYATVDKKLVIVPDEAKAVRQIFERYLELSSIGELSQDLDRRGIRTKRQVLLDGRIRGGCRFGTGALSYLLKNRFYIGEICYRGEVHVGEHTPIIDRALFEAVREKLAQKAVARHLRLKGSPAILTGFLFDDRGNRMTPTHANKRGVRYRYYVSQALLQNWAGEAGSVSRAPAPDVEAIVIKGLRDHLISGNADQRPETIDGPESLFGRALIERHVIRIVLKPRSIEVFLQGPTPAEAVTPCEPKGNQDESDIPNEPVPSMAAPTMIALPWAAPSVSATKGILHAPSAPNRQSMAPETRDALLSAIAKARAWVEDLIAGRASSFEQIAEQEGKVERHVRFLAPLAFVSPGVVKAIMDGAAPADLTVTALAKALPYSWVEQERRISPRA
jgi:DNA invertase Pin-like site-specific DNA recombinase